MSYILIDVSNGDALEPRTAAKIYFWRFKTEKAALKFLADHKSKYESELIGPFRDMAVTELGAYPGQYRAWSKS